MNLDQITTKCWILALFERDDGERLLLGDGWFDFKDSLQHFQPNNIASDIVELQGTDGQLLAGQVRRTASQSFDGYVGDALTSKTEIENRRRQFIQFFRVRRFYKVIYIFPDGSAIQRKRGYLTDAPSVPEMWQKFPEYHVSLSFEDVNYYEYSEDEQGKEIYANTALIELLNLGIGGLVWDSVGAVSHGYTWLEPVTLTGDYITISDALDSAPLSLTELDGNAEQTTYSGKNLFDPDTLPTTWNNTSVTNITLNLKPNTTYTFSSTITKNQYGNADILFYPSGGSTSSSDAGIWNGQSRTATTDSTGSNLIIGYRSQNGTTRTRSGYTYQLEVGSTATAYEPYVGGTASPNPDYPQAINTVTGEQTVKVVGKNLANLPENTTLPMATNPVTVFDNGHDITVSSLVMTFILQDAIYTNSGGALIDFQKADGTHNYRTTPQLRDVNNIAPSANSAFSGTYYLKQTTSLTFRKVNVYLGSSYANWSQGTASLQLELNTTNPTAYEPYTSQSQEINLGKNLFDADNATILNAYIGSTIASSGSNRTSYCKIEPNTTYTLSLTRTAIGGASDDIAIGFTTAEPAIGVSVSDITYSYNTTTVKTFNSGSYGYVVFKYANTTKTDADATLATIQLERGSQATSYASYFTPIELAKIGTYQDRIYKDNGKWYIEKQIGKVIFDGSETWQGQSMTSGMNYYRQVASDALKNTDALLNNQGTGRTFTSSDTSVPAGSCFISSSGNLNFLAPSFSTSTDFRTHLSTTPMVLYYPLATPTTTEITDATLLEQLEHIYSLYDGVNHISITPTAGAQGTMEVKYYTVLDTTGAGYEWEPGGGSSTTTVEVAGIDNAEPIWTVTGPATNPTLTNITTGQTITWNGTVPAGQTLTVDMGEQTATLAGANVYQFISGSWITLRPGPNKLSYSATGGADQPSQLEWNGVVG